VIVAKKAGARCRSWGVNNNPYNPSIFANWAHNIRYGHAGKCLKTGTRKTQCKYPGGSGIQRICACRSKGTAPTTTGGTAPTTTTTTTTTTKPYVTTTTLHAKWYLGDRGLTCTKVCSKKGQLCVDNIDWSKEKELQPAVAKKAGARCRGWGFFNKPYNPSIYANIITNHGRISKCIATQSRNTQCNAYAGTRLKRICACQSAGTPAPTPAPTSAPTPAPAKDCVIKSWLTDKYGKNSLSLRWPPPNWKCKGNGCLVPPRVHIETWFDRLPAVKNSPTKFHYGREPYCLTPNTKKWGKDVNLWYNIYCTKPDKSTCGGECRKIGRYSRATGTRQWVESQFLDCPHACGRCPPEPAPTTRLSNAASSKCAGAPPSSRHLLVSGAWPCVKTGAPCRKVQMLQSNGVTRVGSGMENSAIGVTCCDAKGTGSRPGCKSAVNFDQAVSHCKSVGLDLCTAEQIKSGSGEATGCRFDHGLVWTCSVK